MPSRTRGGGLSAAGIAEGTSCGKTAQGASRGARGNIATKGGRASTAGYPRVLEYERIPEEPPISLKDKRQRSAAQRGSPFAAGGCTRCTCAHARACSHHTESACVRALPKSCTHEITQERTHAQRAHRTPHATRRCGACGHGAHGRTWRSAGRSYMCTSAVRPSYCAPPNSTTCRSVRCSPKRTRCRALRVPPLRCVARRSECVCVRCAAQLATIVRSPLSSQQSRRAAIADLLCFALLCCRTALVAATAVRAVSQRWHSGRNASPPYAACCEFQVTRSHSARCASSCAMQARALSVAGLMPHVSCRKRRHEAKQWHLPAVIRASRSECEQ